MRRRFGKFDLPQCESKNPSVRILLQSCSLPEALGYASKNEKWIRPESHSMGAQRRPDPAAWCRIRGQKMFQPKLCSRIGSITGDEF
ncbi:hypothetical protein ACLKA7_000100 [Drosophila subpalustris]